MNYKADSGYFAIGKQTDANTAVIPDVFVPILEEDLTSDPNNERVKQMVGINWKSNLILQGKRTNGGKFKIYADPDTIGYFLNMNLALGTESGDADGYIHPFTVGTPEYYTIEVLRGNYVHRIVGAQISKLSISFENGNMIVEGEIVAKAKFNYGTLKTALTGAGMVEVVFDEKYDDKPAYGLVAGDIIQTWVAGVATDITIATVAADYKSITCAATTVTAGIGALITLKGQTPSYTALKRPFKFGQMLVGLGANETAATAAAGAYATATPVDEIKIEIDRALESRHASGDNNPIVLEGVPDASLNIKKLFERAEDMQQFNDIAKKACTIIITGDEVTAGNYSSITIKFYNIKPSKVENKTKVGEFIYDETEFSVEYDDTDAIAIDVSLTNEIENY